MRSMMIATALCLVTTAASAGQLPRHPTDGQCAAYVNHLPAGPHRASAMMAVITGTGPCRAAFEREMATQLLRLHFQQMKCGNEQQRAQAPLDCPGLPRSL